METYLILALLIGLFITLITNRFRPPVAFILAVTICLFAGWIEPQQLLHHYSNETLIGLILLLSASSVLEKTHLLSYLSKGVIKEGSLRGSLLRITSITVVLSSILNNTAIVAAFMSVIRQNKHFHASRLLIPLSYAAIMGGVLTLIGTSTNLTVNSLLIEKGLPNIGFFDFIYIGLPLAIAGIIYLIVIAPILLPKNGTLDKTTGKKFFLEADVPSNSPLIGKTVNENGFRKMEHLYLAEIIRKGTLISPVRPKEVIEERDSLFFTGDITQMQELKRYEGLDLHSGIKSLMQSNLQEVVVRHDAPIIGREVKEAQFRTKFNAVIVAVQRGENRLMGKIGEMVLQAGDNLVLSVGGDFEKHQNLNRNFIFISKVQLNDMLSAQQSWAAIGIFLVAILATALNIMSLFQAMLGVIIVFLALRFFRVKHLKNSINFGLLLMIGSSLAIAQVMVTYNVDDIISSAILGLTGVSSPLLALLGIYLATVLVTELITNNAAAALMVPVAIATAESLGVSHVPFAMAIAYGASASFLTPIGYQTNTMVFGIGKYKFTDYTKIGLGLAILYGVVVVLLLPYFFPF